MQSHMPHNYHVVLAAFCPLPPLPQSSPCNTGSVERLELPPYLASIPLLAKVKGECASATEGYTGISGLAPWPFRSLPQPRRKRYCLVFISKFILLPGRPFHSTIFNRTNSGKVNSLGKRCTACYMLCVKHYRGMQGR